MFLKIAVFAFQVLFVMGGYYTLDDELPDETSITKYLKRETEVSCLLQCERDKQCDRIMFKVQNKQMRNGECWFVKQNTTDKGGEMQTLKKDRSIKSYKKVQKYVDFLLLSFLYSIKFTHQYLRRQVFLSKYYDQRLRSFYRQVIIIKTQFLLLR